MTSQSALGILERIGDAWRPLLGAAEALGDSGLEEATPAGWTAKEMLAHVAFWEEAVMGVVHLMFRNQPLPDGWTFGSGYMPADGPWPRDYEHNAREAEWARPKTPAEIMARWDRAHEQLLRIIATVTDDEAGQHAGYFGEIAQHYQEHLPELGALLNGRGVLAPAAHEDRQ